MGPIAMKPYDPVKVLQVTEDQSFNVALVNYQNACRDWIAANIHNRDLGLALSAKPTPPTPRKIWFYDSAHNLTYRFDSLVMAPPELPPDTPKQPPTAFTTGANETADAIHQMLGLLLRMATPEQIAELKRRVAVWGT